MLYVFERYGAWRSTRTVMWEAVAFVGVIMFRYCGRRPAVYPLVAKTTMGTLTFPRLVLMV